jgi:flagellar protein FlgJ
VAASDPELTRRSTADANQQAFLSVVSGAARTAQSQTGVPASVTVAQAILESDWGRSSLAQNANNYFGIKAIGKLGTDGVVYMPTSEYNDAGDLYQTVSPFRAYKSLADSITDHDRMLQLSTRYAKVMQAKSDPKAFAALLYDAGYSTDPAYADKLVALMDRYNLYSLDA